MPSTDVTAWPFRCRWRDVATSLRAASQWPAARWKTVKQTVLCLHGASEIDNLKKQKQNSNMLLIWKNSLRLTTASTWRTATTSVRPLLASESKHELTSSKNALEDKEIKHSNICLWKSNRNRIDRNSVYQARKEGMQFYLVTEGDFSMTDRRTLDKGGMSSADSGMITSSGWVIFTKWEQSSCQSGAGQRAIKRH